MEAKERDMDIYSLNLISGQLAHGFKTIKILYFKIIWGLINNFIQNIFHGRGKLLSRET